MLTGGCWTERARRISSLLLCVLVLALWSPILKNIIFCHSNQTFFMLLVAFQFIKNLVAI